MILNGLPLEDSESRYSCLVSKIRRRLLVALILVDLVAVGIVLTVSYGIRP